MPFQYRIKTKRAEEGDYSDYQPCNKNTILGMINQYWENENMPNGLHVISIMNEAGESLLLEHFEKDVFDVYYLPKSRGYHYHKKSRQEIIYDCLEFFFEEQIDRLEAYLNYTKKDDSFIRDEFFYVDHFYKVSAKRSRSALFWALLYNLPVGIILSVFGLFLLWWGSILLFLLGLLAIGIGTSIWLYGLLIHIRYKKDGKGFAVRLTRGSREIIVRYEGSTKVFDKSEITLVTQVFIRDSDNPWSNYGYVEIKFKSGSIINITNLMVDQLFLLDKFKYDEDVPVKKDRKLIPWLKNKSIVV